MARNGGEKQSMAAAAINGMAAISNGSRGVSWRSAVAA